MNRTREAVGTGADQIAVGCPFCRVMLSDGLTRSRRGRGPRGGRGPRRRADAARVGQGRAGDQGRARARRLPLLPPLRRLPLLLPPPTSRPRTSPRPVTSPSPRTPSPRPPTSVPPPRRPAVRRSSTPRLPRAEPSRRAGVLRIAVRHSCPAERGSHAAEGPGQPAEAFSGGRSSTPPHPSRRTPPRHAAEPRRLPRQPAEAAAEEARRPAGDRPGRRRLALRPRHPRAASPRPRRDPGGHGRVPATEEKPAPAPTADLGSGGSLFDIAAPEPGAAARGCQPSLPIPRPPTSRAPRRSRRPSPQWT